MRGVAARNEGSYMQCDEDDFRGDEPEARGHRNIIRAAQESVAIPPAKQRKRELVFRCSAMIAGKRGANGEG